MTASLDSAPDPASQLARDGYTVLDDVLSRQQVEAMRAVVADLLRIEGASAAAVDQTPYQLRVNLPQGSLHGWILARLYNGVFRAVRRGARAGFRARPAWRAPFVGHRLPEPLSEGPFPRIRRELREMVRAEARQEAVGVEKVCDLLNKHTVFDVCVRDARVLACVDAVIRTGAKLSSLNFRNPCAGHGLQALHTDWPGPVGPDEAYACNTLWVLDDYTDRNGATRIVPGSHRWSRLPEDDMDDPSSAHPNEVRIAARAGSVIVINAHAWHGATRNDAGTARRILQCFFVDRRADPQTDQAAYLRPATRARLDPPTLWRVLGGS